MIFLKSKESDLFKSASFQKIHKMESSGLLSTPTINSCYLYQQVGDVYAAPLCLCCVGKKSGFYQALTDFFEKNTIGKMSKLR